MTKHAVEYLHHLDFENAKVSSPENNYREVGIELFHIEKDNNSLAHFTLLPFFSTHSNIIDNYCYVIHCSNLI